MKLFLHIFEVSYVFFNFKLLKGCIFLLKYVNWLRIMSTMGKNQPGHGVGDGYIFVSVFVKTLWLLDELYLRFSNKHIHSIGNIIYYINNI